MAKAGRTDGVVLTGDAVTLKFTQGEAPLPAGWQGEALNFASRAEFVAALAEVESRVSGQDLALLQAAKAYKADPNFGSNFVNGCNNKCCTLDLTGTAAPIVVA